ncbi:hypothetical protein SAMN05216276_102698 [Streptosporangium subroseum]|uniref:Uncharacterized protein n=1 Tax=Streptosporangium subroseum TaxID=106412 RepID=A0A239KCZ4_9ACTN|nr:hypothetical protein SAMN05216276_102698 [Streptosporangium subroseum]
MSGDVSPSTAGLAPVSPPRNTSLTSLSSAFGNSCAGPIVASPVVTEAVRVLLPSGEPYISAP